MFDYLICVITYRFIDFNQRNTIVLNCKICSKSFLLLFKFYLLQKIIAAIFKSKNQNILILIALAFLDNLSSSTVTVIGLLFLYDRVSSILENLITSLLLFQQVTTPPVIFSQSDFLNWSLLSINFQPTEVRIWHNQQNSSFLQALQNPRYLLG